MNKKIRDRHTGGVSEYKPTKSKWRTGREAYERKQDLKVAVLVAIISVIFVTVLFFVAYPA